MNVREKELEVCDKLKTLRERAHLSQMDLAFKAGVSQNMVGYIESGKRTPTLSTLLKMCEALGVSPASLFTKDEYDIEEVRDVMHKYIDYFVR